MHPRLRLLYLGALLIHSILGQAASNHYLQTLQHTARELRLAEDPQWQALLHYHRRIFGNRSQSFQDDPAFFLAATGKSDPQAELDASLTAFFKDRKGEPDAQPQCRFIARYRWLEQRLRFDPQRLPVPECPDFNRWMQRLAPRGITLVYASSFLNNPASLFGHTLLRIDGQHDPDTADLLDFAINYAAHTEGERGLGFAIKGLTGGYQGQFSTLPYALMVKEYGDIENRDLWEYRLALKPEEIERLLQHVWELRSAHFDYFFLDENCSYHLLALLEVARPTLHLTDKFETWVIPTDTLRELTRLPGLIARVDFRPARSTVLKQRQAAAGTWVREATSELIEAPNLQPIWSRLQNAAPQQQAKALELAEDYLQYETASPRHRTKAASERAFELLQYRSQIDVPDQTPPVPRPPVPPEQGHGTSRLLIGTGFDDEAWFTQLGYRPAYHDLLDPAAGYAPGTQLQFLNLNLRANPATAQVQLDHLDVVDMVALTPWDGLLRPFSWRASVGLLNRHQRDGTMHLIGGVRGGLGVSALLQRSILAYTLLEAQFALDGEARHYIDLAAGPVAGFYLDATSDWRLGFEAQWQRYALGNPTNDISVALSQRITLTADLAVRSNLTWRREFGREYMTVNLGLAVYF